MSKIWLTLAAAGLVSLLATAPARAEVEGQPCVDDPSTPEMIAYTDIRTCQITPIGDTDSYTFDGLDGETVLFAVNDSDGGSDDICIRVFRPDGTEFLPSTCTEVAQVLEHNLDQDSDIDNKWIIQIAEAGSDQTTAYNLLLERINPPSPATTQLEAPGVSFVDGMISPVGDIDFFSFFGEDGNLVQITANDIDGGTDDICYRIFRPDRTEFRPFECAEVALVVEVTLDQDGFWGLEVVEASSDQTTNFSLVYDCPLGCPLPPETVACEVALNQDIFVLGDQIIVDSLRLTNPTSDPVAIELKSYFKFPSGATVPLARIGGNGGTSLPALADIELGPRPGPMVTAGFPISEEYEFACRILNPVTGSVRHFDRDVFAVQ